MMYFNNNNSSRPKKKVVSIPVHFVDSERKRNNSAIKIQKMVRGFLVRNSMKKIKGIKVELEMIEDKVCVQETMELIKKNHKERVKFIESIMNLLLKLDNVRVLDYYSVVRGYRKSVIQKAIALQEMIDQIQIVDPTHRDQNQSAQVDLSTRDSYLVKCEDDVVVRDSDVVKCEDDIGARESDIVKSKDNTSARDSHIMKSENDVVPRESYIIKCEDDAGVLDSYFVKSEKEEENGDGVGEEMVEENCLVEEEVDEGFENGIGREGDYEKNKNKELLQRMVEDNEKMMDMMAQLFKRNEMQTKLLTSLSQRVEQLERAYVCDKLRKKKRRNVDAKHK